MGGKPLVNRDGPLGLLAMILRESPDLRGAACAGRGRLFDPDRTAEDLGLPSREARERAVEELCISCPVRARCWAWASSINPNRITGPTASTANISAALGPRRPRRAAALPAPEDPEPEITTPRPAQRRGARSRIKPSVNRRRRRNRR